MVGVEYKVYGSDYTPVNAGFGLSEAVPIIVSLLKAKQGTLVIIENPEAHLHTKGQRKMGELIASASAGAVQIILETNSYHILNGIRLSVTNCTKGATIPSILTNDTLLRFCYGYQRTVGALIIQQKIVINRQAISTVEKLILC